MRLRLGFPKLLDVYVSRICLGSFAVCFCFICGLFVLTELLDHVDDWLRNIERLPPEWSRLGVFLIAGYYLAFLPFLYVTLSPFVTVTAGMFAVSRLMASNEIVPMVFTGRRVSRILLPLFLLAIVNGAAMLAVREYVLPKVLPLKDDLASMLNDATVDRPLRGKVVRLPDGSTLWFDRFFLKSNVLEGVDLKYPSGDWLEAERAAWRDDGASGPGWYLTNGRTLSSSNQGTEVAHLAPGTIPGFDPPTLKSRLKDRQELWDLPLSVLRAMVAEQPNVLEYSVALHHHLTFPLANVLLLLLALPFALRFERGGRTERVFFALLVCGAYFVVDLTFRNLGNQGLVHPVVAAWLPTLIFGSLGIVIFDTVRS